MKTTEDSLDNISKQLDRLISLYEKELESKSVATPGYSYIEGDCSCPTKTCFNAACPRAMKITSCTNSTFPGSTKL